MLQKLATAVGIAGGLSDLFDNSDGGRRDAQASHEALQREFAQNGIKWRVDDARSAGIHPGLALGAQLAGPSSFVFEGNNRPSIGASLSKVGHSIQRSVDASSTAVERAHSRTMAALSVENAGLQNQMLRSQIARLNSSQVGPPMADPANPGVRTFGTSDAHGLIKEEPLARIAGAPGSPHQEAGSVTDLGFSRTATGFAVVPSKDWKDRGEDQFMPEVTWAIRNHLLPSLSPSRYGMPPPESWLPEGADGWRFDRLKQEWQPRFTARGQSRVRYPLMKGGD